MNSNIKNEIVVSSPKYQQASIKFRNAWLEYMDHEKRVKYEVVNMVTILEKDGLSRTKALQKIIEDHNDLKGFSRATIYRELPEDMKRTDSKKDLKRLNENGQNATNKRLHVSNETYEGINKTKQSEALKDFRDTKGTIVQSAKEQEEEQEVIYDSKFVDALIAENEQLKTENFRLKKDYQELETKYKKLLNNKK